MAEAPDPADTIGEIDRDVPVVPRPGDLWTIGSHRLLCGDATDAAAYARLLDSQKAQIVFTDPPYNVPIDGHVSGQGRARLPHKTSRNSGKDPSGARIVRVSDRRQSFLPVADNYFCRLSESPIV